MFFSAVDDLYLYYIVSLAILYKYLRLAPALYYSSGLEILYHKGDMKPVGQLGEPSCQ